VMLPELSRLCSQMLAPPHVLEQVLQNKLGTALAILTAERQRVTTRETMRGPHRDKEQRDRLREIATLQIVLTVLKRPPGNNEGGPEEQSRTRDRVWRKIQSWDVIRRLDMIAPEIINPAVSHLLPSSSLELLAQLVQRWKDWKCRKWTILSKHNRERTTPRSGLSKDGPS